MKFFNLFFMSTVVAFVLSQQTTTIIPVVLVPAFPIISVIPLINGGNSRMQGLANLVVNSSYAMTIYITVNTTSNITGAWIHGPALPGSSGVMLQDISSFFLNSAIDSQSVNYVWRMRRYAQGST